MSILNVLGEFYCHISMVWLWVKCDPQCWHLKLILRHEESDSALCPLTGCLKQSLGKWLGKNNVSVWSPSCPSLNIVYEGERERRGRREDPAHICVPCPHTNVLQYPGTKPTRKPSPEGRISCQMWPCTMSQNKPLLFIR
jgi:hypothetical protein